MVKATRHKRIPNASERVLLAISELTASGRQATRTAVAEITGFRQSIVDDHIKRLKAQEHIRLLERGVYVVDEEERDPLIISFTTFGEGVYKLDVGDKVLDLRWIDVRALWEVIHGAATRFGDVSRLMPTRRIGKKVTNG